MLITKLKEIKHKNLKYPKVVAGNEFLESKSLYGRFFTRVLLGFSAENTSIYSCKFYAAAPRIYGFRGTRRGLSPFLRNLNLFHRLRSASRLLDFRGARTYFPDFSFFSKLSPICTLLVPVFIIFFQTSTGTKSENTTIYMI